jgi:hypothetical protein
MRCCVSSLVLGALVLTAGCSSQTLKPAEARRLIEAAPRFQAPETFRARTQYCSSGDATESVGLMRLKMLADAGAVTLETRPAAAGECTSLTGPVRQHLTVTLTDVGSRFHPELLENGIGWDFLLAHRRVVSVKDIQVNDQGDHPLARVLYQWAWHDELLGQLMQVSEEPVNAQATFTQSNGTWSVRDLGF